MLLLLLICFSNENIIMIKIRYKPLKSGKYSVYLDIYAKNATGHSQRNYDFLGIYVSKDYSKIKRIAEVDKEKIELAKAIKAKKEIEIINSAHGFNNKSKLIKADVFSTIETINVEKQDINLTSALKKLKAFANQPQLTVSEINEEFIKDFWDYLILKIAHNTCRTYFKRIKTALNQAVAKKMIPYNPMTDYRIPGEKDTERIPLTFEEVQKLQNTETNFNPDIRNGFLFGCFTGLRISDIRRLKWKHIHDGQIVINPKKTENTTGKLIYNPLTDQAKKMLEELKENSVSEYIFPNLPKGSYDISIKLNQWAKEAHVNKHLHFHMSRHTFATVGLTYGVDLYTMQKLLGHSKIEMTQVYAKIIDQKKREEVAKFPKFDN